MHRTSIRSRFNVQMITIIIAANGLQRYLMLYNFPHWIQKSYFVRLYYELDQTWLRVRCHQEWEFRPLLFPHSWTIQGPESTC